MDMPVEKIVQALPNSYRTFTREEPKGIGLPASELGARYGDDARLWAAGIPAPICDPSGGSYGEDFARIDEMVLCSRVLALTSLDCCARGL